MRRPSPIRILLTAGVCSAALGIGAGTSSAQPAVSPWPMFQHDAQNTGRTNINGPMGPKVRIVWGFPTDKPVASAPSIGGDGTVFVGSGRTPLIAVHPATGQKIWRTDDAAIDCPRPGGCSGDIAQSQPVVSADGRIYFGARDNDLWAVNPNGSVRWRYHVISDGDITAPSTMGPDGTIYAGSTAAGRGFFFAMPSGPDGVPRWQVQLARKGFPGTIFNNAPALSPDGRAVYVVTGGKQIIALDTATGEELWRKQVTKTKSSARASNFSPVVAPNGTIYLATPRGGLFALDVSGNVLWNFPVAAKERVASAAALGGEGTIYFSAWRKVNVLYAVHPNGTQRWARSTIAGKTRNLNPAIGANGVIYLPVKNTLYAFAPADGHVLWELPFPYGFSSGAVIGAPGRLYVGNKQPVIENGVEVGKPTLYAIENAP